MKRIELIANRSVETEIIEALEGAIEDFHYTLLPQIHGKGKTRYRLGTATWPELNFFLMSGNCAQNISPSPSIVQR